jgi:O-acetyl-ADP-ribose deacetylase (regulator of RNase III)
MTDIEYVVGDATSPLGSGPRIIVHVCNDVGGWGAGFVLAVSRRWSLPESEYRRWYAERDGNDFGLGEVQLVRVESELFVANLIGQHGLRRSGGPPPIRYDAVSAGLAKVRAHAKAHEATVHMPRIGCGLAGGKWEQIEPIILRELTLHGVEVTVYDFGGPARGSEG